MNRQVREPTAAAHLFSNVTATSKSEQDALLEPLSTLILSALDPCKPVSQMRALCWLAGALSLLSFAVPTCTSQETEKQIVIKIHARQPDGPMIRIWN